MLSSTYSHVSQIEEKKWAHMQHSDSESPKNILMQTIQSSSLPYSDGVSVSPKVSPVVIPTHIRQLQEEFSALHLQSGEIASEQPEANATTEASRASVLHLHNIYPLISGSRLCTSR